MAVLWYELSSLGLAFSDVWKDYMNRNGSNVGSKVLMIVVAILNAGRNSFSFFLLLIVCMGYGVVKHSLGKTMIYVRYLAGAHFVFGLIYSIASLTVTPETAGKSILVDLEATINQMQVLLYFSSSYHWLVLLQHSMFGLSTL